MRLIKQSHFLRDVGLVSVAEGLAGLIALVFTISCARLLGVESYGLLQALLALFATLSFFLLPLYFVSLHVVARVPDEEKQGVCGELLVLSALVSLLIASGLAFVAPIVAQRIQSTSVAPVYAIALLLIVRCLLSVLYGALQAQNQYRRFAQARILETAICLVIGVSLIFSGLNVSGALGGYLFSYTLVLLYFLVRDRPPILATKFDLIRKELISMRRMFLCLAAVLFISNFPIFFARTTLDPEQSGMLGALYNLRNVVLPFSFAICVPFYSRTLSTSEESALFKKALLLICLVGFGFVCSSYFLSAFIVSSIYGSQFLGAAPHLAYYGISLWLEMIALLFVFNGLAHEEQRAIDLVPGVGLSVILLFSFQPAMISAVLDIQVTSWLVFIIFQKKTRKIIEAISQIGGI